MRYTELDKMLKGRNANSKKEGNNTYWQRRGDAIALLYHSTDVATFKPSGDIVLDSGGWHTSTTKERIGWALAGTQFGIYQKNSVWYIVKSVNGFTYLNTNPTFRFNDGMALSDATGTVTGHIKDSPKADKVIKAKVKAYAKLCADAVPLDQPGPGDCFYCAMSTDKGQSLGDAFKDTSHFDSHIEGGYIVPSLVHRALTECYNAPMAFWQAFKDTGWTSEDRDFGRRAVGKAVYRYILKRKGYAA